MLKIVRITKQLEVLHSFGAIEITHVESLPLFSGFVTILCKHTIQSLYRQIICFNSREYPR